MASEKKKSTTNEQIRQNLQRVYQEALDDEIPSEFIQMIERLKAEKEAKTDAE